MGLKTGTVYFIACEANGLVKIGYSSGPASRRLSGLQTGSPTRLTILAEVPGTREDEKAWHSRFRHLRAHGEWFQMRPELEQAIAPWLLAKPAKQEEPSDDLLLASYKETWLKLGREPRKMLPHLRLPFVEWLASSGEAAGLPRLKETEAL